MTTIISVKPIDFNDKEVIKKEIDDFINKYAYADIEYALEISPTGKAYILKGINGNVNSEILGKDILKGSISIHNHPVLKDNDRGDSFSKHDLVFAAEYKTGIQYIVSGERRDAFMFTEHYTNDEIESAWNKTRYKIWEYHDENDTYVVFEQEEILRELRNYLKGVVYYENI